MVALEEEKSLEEVLVNVCPCLSMAINHYYKTNNLEKLVGPNHFSINRYTAMDYLLNLDTEVLELILDKMYDSNFTQYIQRSDYSYYENFSNYLYEKDILFTDTKISQELHQIKYFFDVGYRKDYVYSVGHISYAALEFSLNRADLEDLISRMDMGHFDLMCRRLSMERKFD